MQTDFKSFLVSFYLWTFILVTLLPFFLLYLVIWILVYPFDGKRAVTHAYTVLWTRLYLTFNPGWKLKIENRHRIMKNKKYILISNHQSMIDIALLMQLRLNFKWVSKVELARVPFVGWVIWMNNHILVRRGEKQSVIQMAEACKRTLLNGISIFFFPEGTRTEDGQIQAFKEGAFILARENGVPILPVILDGSGCALPNKGFRFKVNQVFTVRVLNEISVETINNLELSQLMVYARNCMTKELDNIRQLNTREYYDR